MAVIGVDLRYFNKKLSKILKYNNFPLSCHLKRIFILIPISTKMIAIADSGTTKTSWLFIDSVGNTYHHKTVGFNPYYQTTENILNNLQSGLIPNLEFKDTVRKIYFYGAGCELPEKCEQVAVALRQSFPDAEVHVWHDLLAAARAVLGDEEGIACIAGTGANSCYYDGKEVISNVESLGLFLGDEGSGGYKGKLLLKDYMRNNMPAHIREKFEAKYTDRTASILDNVYTKPFPSRYLASFMPFIVENIADPYVYKLAYKSFEEQFDACISKYPRYQELNISFIGSVAFYLKDVLAQVAKDKGCTLNKVIRNPMEGLAEYHVSKGLMD
ncbi:MAG: hypothetical protein RL711_848 [Bacteroidota bacterium]|jgi:N-acetylglucosamine kinase-like BadF-type ATPase